MSGSFQDKLLLLLLLVTQGLAIRWMALLHSGSVASLDQPDQCEGLSGLTRRQVRICQRNLEVMEAVRGGAGLSLRECQWQFRARRWNCSTPLWEEVADGTRESAYLHAVSAAGVAHSVTRACSGGSLGRCGCDRTVRGLSPEGFQWSGCSDNVHYGTAFAKSFVDARDLRKARKGGKEAARALMNLHNNEVGRKVVEYNMRVECKCHGVSGSCETRTCWRALPRFRLVGELLRERFDGAALVRPGGGRRLVPAPSSLQQPRHHSDTDLVFIESSPDFCEEPGTRGRPCNRTADSEEGCDALCCGRGHETRTETVVERCGCKFHWCCYVRCAQCERNIERHYCL